MRVLGIYESTTVTIASIFVDAKTIFTAALLANACSIVVAHNHPSGDLESSRADELAVKKLIKAGKCLGIDVLDHLIITRDSFLSFRQEGLINDTLQYSTIV
jgi:DNA repair protein RadC